MAGEAQSKGAVYTALRLDAQGDLLAEGGAGNRHRLKAVPKDLIWWYLTGVLPL